MGSGKSNTASALVSRGGGTLAHLEEAADRRELRLAVDRARETQASGTAPRARRDRTVWAFDELGQLPQVWDWVGTLAAASGRRSGFLVTSSRATGPWPVTFVRHRLHPLTLSEVLGLALPGGSFLELPTDEPSGAQEALELLLRRGGLPAGFQASERGWKRWSEGQGVALVALWHAATGAGGLDLLERLAARLPATVGRPLSVQSLRTGLGVSFETVARRVRSFEEVFGGFRIAPFVAPGLKAVTKEQKLYLWDWSAVPREAPRLENLVAAHLMRLVHWLEDVEGVRVELRYFRDVVGHEVSFLVLAEGQALFAVEVTPEAVPPTAGLSYLLQRVRVPLAFQVHLSAPGPGRVHGVERELGGSRWRGLSLAHWLCNLP